MKKIGITGCIGSGKSTVATIFRNLNVPVYDADSRAKYLMVLDALLKQQIQNLLGVEAYQTDGTLNRSWISGQVFNHPELLEQLNALVHPAVFDDFDHWCTQQQAPYVLKEAALLFESGSYKKLDAVIVVSAPESLRLQRTILRDGISEGQVRARMKNQLSEEEKVRHSQYEIRNNETELVIPQVLQLHRVLLA